MRAVLAIVPWLTAAAVVAALWVWAPHVARWAGVTAFDELPAAQEGGAAGSLDDCDLATSACSVMVESSDGRTWRATLNLTPKPVPMLAPIIVELTLDPVESAANVDERWLESGSPPTDEFDDESGITQAQTSREPIQTETWPWPDRWMLDLSGVEMFMGVNRVTLTRAVDDGERVRGLYRGSAYLPLCTSQQMTWDASLSFSDSPTSRVAVFGLTTDRRHVGFTPEGQRAIDALFGGDEASPGRALLDAPLNSDREHAQ